MTLTLILPNKEEFKVKNPLFNTSQLITNLLIDTGKEDVNISVSPIYASVIHIYVEFLNEISFNDNGEVIYPDDLPIINDVKTLFLCFLLESFFADNTFFKFLMEESYKLWSDFLPDVYLLPDERLFYLYSPYEFVPESYFNSPTFFKEWLEINANKNIVLNGNDVYYTKVDYYPNREIKELKAYHTINNEEVGHEFMIYWYENGQLKYKSKYKDGKQDGLHEEWYESGQLQYKGDYKDGKRDGLHEYRYRNGQLLYKYNYRDGKYNGLWERWDANGQPECKKNYKDGKLDGLQEIWYRNGQLCYKGSCKDDIEDGLQEEWYENGQLQHKKIIKMVNEMVYGKDGMPMDNLNAKGIIKMVS